MGVKSERHSHQNESNVHGHVFAFCLAAKICSLLCSININTIEVKPHPDTCTVHNGVVKTKNRLKGYRSQGRRKIDNWGGGGTYSYIRVDRL